MPFIDGRLRYRFSDQSDLPAEVDSSADAGVTWTPTRNVAVPELGLAAFSTAGSSAVQLANLHGDIVATMPDTLATTGISSYAETDEYGNAPSATNTARYGWLGSQGRSRDTLGGVVLMGARVYNPVIGAFLQSDPVVGGGATAYTYPQDPINQFDTTGRCFWCSAVLDFLHSVWHFIEHVYPTFSQH